MCDTVNGKLELLFAHLSLNNVQHIQPLLMEAIDEYQAIRRSLSYEEKRNLNFIKNLLWHAERGEWAQARHKLNDAQRAYQDYIGKKIDIMKKPIGYAHIHGRQKDEPPAIPDIRKYMFRTDEIPNPLNRATRQRYALDYPRPSSLPASKESRVVPFSAGRERVSDGEEQGPTESGKRLIPRYTGLPQYNPEPKAENLDKALALPGSRHVTTALQERREDFQAVAESNRPTNIGEAYWSIYQHEWRKALEAIKLTGISEEKAIGCLFYIIQEAFQFCLLEAKAQVLEFENAALNIMTEGRYSQEHKKNLVAGGNIKHLIRYRHEVANVAVSHLQEIFLTKILPLIHRKYSVRTRNAIDDYARRCVEVTWRMAIQDPPLQLVFENESANKTEFDDSVYDPYIRAGKTVKYYVWPALKLYEGGPVLRRGVAHAETYTAR